MKKIKDKKAYNNKMMNEVIIKVPFFYVKFPIKNNLVYYLFIGFIALLLLNFIIVFWKFLQNGFSP